MKKLININKNSGYAILFAVVVVSIISILSFGLSNTTYKQLILSSLSSDSQISYLQSDMATECGLYADNIVGLGSLPASWNCGIDSSGNIQTFNVVNDGSKYKVSPVTLGTKDPCFEFDIDKTTIPGTTVIKARGYNSCDKSSSKTVEREVEVTYQ
jgi:hypothetical protein